jgi:hypothetical protein
MEAVRHDAEHRAEHPDDGENAGQDKADDPAEIRALSGNDHVHAALDPFKAPVKAIHPVVETIHATIEAVHAPIYVFQSGGRAAGNLLKHGDAALHIGRIPATAAWINWHIGHDATSFGAIATIQTTNE